MHARFAKAPKRFVPSGNRGVSAVMAVAVLVVGIELFTAATHIRLFAQVGYKNLRASPHLVRDADLDPFAYFAPTQALVAAQRIIPKDATYTIVVGHEQPGPSATIADDIFRFWLVPRHYTPSIREADWAITYNESSESLGVPLHAGARARAGRERGEAHARGKRMTRIDLGLIGENLIILAVGWAFLYGIGLASASRADAVLAGLDATSSAGRSSARCSRSR